MKKKRPAFVDKPLLLRCLCVACEFARRQKRPANVAPFEHAHSVRKAGEKLLEKSAAFSGPKNEVQNFAVD